MNRRIIFLSDVHLSVSATEKTGRFINFLDSIKNDVGTIYILGDLFDFWVGPKHATRITDYYDVFTKIKELTKNDVEINFLYGNRDFHIDLFFTHILGMKILGNNRAIEIDDKKIFLTHGDMFCTKDTKFITTSNIIRSSFARQFFLVLPFELRYYIAKGFRGISKRAVPKKEDETKGLVYDTIRGVFERGFDIIVCGHIHKPQKVRFDINGKDKYLYTLGDWENRTSFLEFIGGEFCIRSV